MSTQKRKIAKLEDITKLIERGSLSMIFYDTEIFNLSRVFPGVYEFGAHIKDLAGNEIASPEFRARRPADTVTSIASHLITRTFASDMDQGDDFATFSGKMHDLFDRFESYVWDRYTEEQKIHYVGKNFSKQDDEIVRLFPVIAEDGSTINIRIHENGKYISYPLPDWDRNLYTYTDIDAQGRETKWRKVRQSSEMKGYSNTSADDPWLWSDFHMSLSPELFVTHTKKERKNRTDIFNAAIAVYLWGPQGEDGLKPGKRIHPVTGKEVYSFKQSDLIQANTHLESHERGKKAGILMQKSKAEYEPDFAHGAKADAAATSAIDDKLRDIAPAIMHHMEALGSVDYAKNYFLYGRIRDGELKNQPLHAVARYNLNDGPSSHLMMPIGIDDQYGARKQIVLLKMDINWDNISDENGKSLLDIRSKDKLKELIRSKLWPTKNKGDGPLEICSLRKTPKAWIAEEAVRVGRHSEEQWQMALANRSKVLRNRILREALMEVYEENLGHNDPHMNSASRMEEEFLFLNVGDLDYFKTTDGHVIDYKHEAHAHAMNEIKTARKEDNALKRILSPQRIEWCPPSEEKEALQLFHKRLAQSKKDLAEIGFGENKGHIERPPKRIPDYSGNHGKAPKNKEQAIEYLRKLRFAALYATYTQDNSFTFHDFSEHFDIVDDNGHKVSWERYNEIPLEERHNFWNSGKFDVRFESVQDISARILTRMLYEKGDIELLKEKFAADGEEHKLECLNQWEEMHTARIALMMHGLPYLENKEQPFSTIDKALKEAYDVLENPKALSHICASEEDEIGALEVLSQHHDEAMAILYDFIDYWESQRELAPKLTAERLLMRGFNPETGQPLLNIEHEVPAESLIPVRVPDDHMLHPLHHTQIGAGNFVLADLGSKKAVQQLKKAVDHGYNIELIGARSGRRHLAVNAKIMPLWQAEKDGYYSEQLEKARTSYQNNMAAIPKNRDTVAVIVFEDAPMLAGRRGDLKNVNPNLQTLNLPAIPGKKFFWSMIDPVLGNVKKPVSGMIARKDSKAQQQFKPGPVRLREMASETEATGLEIEHQITATYHLNMKKLLTAKNRLANQTYGKIKRMHTGTLQKMGFQDREDAMLHIRVLNNPQRYGYNTADEMLDRLSQLYANKKHQIATQPEKFDFTIFEFKQYRDLQTLKDTLVFFDPANRPKACVTRQFDLSGSKPPLPGAKNINDNNREGRKPTLHSAGHQTLAPGMVPR